VSIKDAKSFTRLKVLLRRHRRDVAEIENIKANLFYHGTLVLVNCSRYTGPGITVTDGMCPTDRVAVSLPNGNTWYYDAEHVKPNTFLATTP
jgi:hypothetical protein